jgi:hypothetical protein
MRPITATTLPSRPARLRDLDVVEGPDMIGSVFVISVKPF